MQISKYGHIKPKKIVCRECGATLSYTPVDVKRKSLAGRSYDVVICPVCGCSNRVDTANIKNEED